VHLSLLSFAAGTSISHAIVYSSSEAIATPTALSSPAAPCPPGVPAPLVLAIIAPTWAGGSPTSPPEEKKEDKSVNSRFTLYACPEPVLANDLFFQELLDTFRKTQMAFRRLSFFPFFVPMVRSGSYRSMQFAPAHAVFKSSLSSRSTFTTALCVQNSRVFNSGFRTRAPSLSWQLIISDAKELEKQKRKRKRRQLFHT
jgi:hypothetical protein